MRALHRGMIRIFEKVVLKRRELRNFFIPSRAIEIKSKEYIYNIYIVYIKKYIL